jgi:hypothetical protein
MAAGLVESCKQVRLLFVVALGDSLPGRRTRGGGRERGTFVRRFAASLPASSGGGDRRCGGKRGWPGRGELCAAARYCGGCAGGGATDAAWTAGAGTHQRRCAADDGALTRSGGEPVSGDAGHLRQSGRRAVGVQASRGCGWRARVCVPLCWVRGRVKRMMRVMRNKMARMKRLPSGPVAPPLRMGLPTG